MIRLLRLFLYISMFAVLTGPGDPGNWGVGLALASAVALVGMGRPPQRLRAPVSRLLWLPWLAWGVAKSMAAGSWVMLVVLLGLRPWRHVGSVTCENVAQTEQGLALLAVIQSATPGSVVAEADAEAKSIEINVIDARDPERERRAVAQFYQRYQARSVR